jgi:hypothetical protein
MVVHAHDDERGLGRDGQQRQQPAHARGAEDRLVDHHHGRPHTAKQADQVRDVSHRGYRFDPRLGLHKAPESGAHAIVTSGDEDRHRRRMEGDGLCGHVEKHRAREAGPHPDRRLNLPP